MAVSLQDIFEVYRVTIEGLRQQSLPGEFEDFENTYPRDPLYIARGIEAAFGIRITFKVVDFYSSIDISDEKKDFFSFYEYRRNEEVWVFLNKAKLSDGSPLVSTETLRFIVLKEIFTGSLRAAITKKLISTDASYPDTVHFGEFISAHLDWISEKFSVYAFVDGEDFSATVSVENAAELLAIIFLVNLSELYQARVALDVQPKPLWKVKDTGSLKHDSDEADLRFSLFEYARYADSYGVKVRFVVVLIKTDFILKIVDGIRQIARDAKDILKSIGLG